MHADVERYNATRSTPAEREICTLLGREIDRGLPGAENRIWHAHPVWFLDQNPIVGYSCLKDGVRLLFWSGQSFDESGLKPQGKFKAAEVRFADVSQVDTGDLARWLAKAAVIQWDYANIAKRKGRLERIS